MSTSISDTVQTTLNDLGLSAYATGAQPVVEALEARETEIKANLRSIAESRGVSPREVDSLLEQAGFTPAAFSEPEPTHSAEVPTSEAPAREAEASTLDALKDLISQFADKVRNL